MRILESASCIAVIVSLVIAVDLATNTYDGDAKFGLEMRNRRDVKSTLNYTGCGHWTDWISRNTPTLSSPYEREQLSNEDLNVLCPSTGGATVKDFQCRDETGQAIHDVFNKTDVSNNTYVYTCSNMQVACFMLNASNTKDHCPDFALRIMCECPQTTSALSSTEKSQSLSRSSSADRNLSLGGTSLPGWLIPLVVSLLLFVVNLILVLFVYNKLKQQMRPNQVGPI